MTCASGRGAGRVSAGRRVVLAPRPRVDDLVSTIPVPKCPADPRPRHADTFREPVRNITEDLCL